MALWRFIKVLLAALIIFVVFNFFISNTTPGSNSLATLVSFKFDLPWTRLESIDFKVGSLLLISFILGMVFAALIGALQAFTRSREVKMKNKTIRELEKEIGKWQAAAKKSLRASTSSTISRT